ncbi:class I SAM-dependent methyltransferase [Blastococcus sp. SYSU D01042]
MPGPDDDAARSRGRSFWAVAAGYAALRPGYPADAVTHLVGRGGRSRRVLDVGAGTGLLTRAVRDAGHDVLAVDPAPEMLAQLTSGLPGVPVAAGTAEALPVGDATVDAVVAGQAAHWFDVAPAAAEIRRVLRPGGVLGLVWNTRDEDVPWVAALGAALAGEARGHEADQAVVDGFAAALGADVEVAASGIVQRLTPEEVVGGIATRSYVAVMGGSERAAFLARVRDVLATHPGTRGRAVLDLPYRTAAYRLTPR